MDELTDVEIRRSTRRRRTISARREGGRLIVLMPAGLSQADEQRYVREMRDKVAAKEQRRRPGDVDLHDRARMLSRTYFDGRAVPTSVRWVTNQRTRWGSCTPSQGSIRLSHRLQEMPNYVIDYVLCHELAHLIERGHGPRFQALVAAYPRTERAQGYLEGYSGREGAVDDGADDEDGAGYEDGAE